MNIKSIENLQKVFSLVRERKALSRLLSYGEVKITYDNLSLTLDDEIKQDILKSKLCKNASLLVDAGLSGSDINQIDECCYDPCDMLTGNRKDTHKWYSKKV